MLMLFFSVTSCSKTCPVVTCNGIFVDGMYREYQLDVSQQYYNADPIECKTTFNEQYMGKVIPMHPDANHPNYTAAPLNGCHCICE